MVISRFSLLVSCVNFTSLAIMALISRKPSSHRCKILTVSRLLSRADVDDILYLSEDFIPQSEVGQISSGVDLMRSLERHGRLGPGRYDYLLACLKEIGRLDLAKIMTEFLYSYLLGSLPRSFRLSRQAYATKLHILMSKQSRYVESMRNLQTATSDARFWEELRSKDVHRLLSCTSKSASSLPWKVGELLQIILDGLANIAVPWLAAVNGFLQGTRVERKLLQHIHSNKRKLRNDLTGAGLNEIFSSTERPLHLDRAVSTASSALFDLLSELLGKAAEEERVERLLTSLSDIKSITPESYSFGTIIQLLLLLTKMAVCSSIECHSCEPLLKTLLHQQKNVFFYYNRQLMQIFQGTKLAEKVPKMELQELESICDESNSAAKEIDGCPLVITVLVCILTLLSAPELTPMTWQLIEKQLLEYLRLQQQNTTMVTGHIMPRLCEALQHELDDFRDTSLMELVRDVPRKDDSLQHLIASVLNY